MLRSVKDESPSRPELKIPHRWWNAEQSTVASALTGWAENIEKWSWNRRYLNMVCARFMTGREVSTSYSFSMVRRPSAWSSAWSSAQWRPPSFNGIATCADVFSARIWKNRPFIQVVPLATGGFKARMRAKKLSRFFDGVAEQTRLWDTIERIGIDCMTTGTGLVKVGPDVNDPKRIAITRVLDDEILVSDEEGLYHEPRAIGQRAFFHREELLGRYPEHASAIMRAPSVFPAFSYGDVNYQDIVPLVEGWSRAQGGQPGRHVVALPGAVLLDEEYPHDWYPFAVIRFRQLSHSWFGQGLAEQLLGLQAEISRIQGAIAECQERVAWPRVLVEAGSKVSREALAGIAGGIIKYTAIAPTFVAPAAVPPELFQREQTLIALLFRRAGISEQAAGGMKPTGLNSGAALMAWAQIDDARHVDLMQRLEAFITDVAMLAFKVSEDVKPRVVVPGRRGQQIDWKDARLALDEYSARAFPMSRLPQTIAGREQTINDWLANGQITKQEAMRLGGVPDTEAQADLSTAARDYIDNVLDELIEGGEWTPPEPFMDLQLALQVAQSRWMQESTLGTPQDRTDLLLQWISAVGELIEQSAPEAPIQSGPAPVGIQPPAGAPAPTAPQIMPAAPPPAQ